MPLLLFDIDGTLLRRAGSHHREALESGIHRVTGLTVTWDGVDTSGMLDRDLIRILLSAAGVPQRRIQRSMRHIVTECETAYLGNCAADLRDRLCAGVVPLLSEAQRQKLPLGLVTGNLARIGWKKMELAGIRDFFQVGAFAEDGRTRARVAQIARWRAVRAGLATRRDRVALIGDHANDVRAARANGFISVAVGTGVMPVDELRKEQPDIFVPDLTQLRLDQLF